MDHYKTKVKTQGMSGWVEIDGKDVPELQAYSIEHDWSGVPIITLNFNCSEALSFDSDKSQVYHSCGIGPTFPRAQSRDEIEKRLREVIEPIANSKKKAEAAIQLLLDEEFEDLTGHSCGVDLTPFIATLHRDSFESEE